MDSVTYIFPHSAVYRHKLSTAGSDTTDGKKNTGSISLPAAGMPIVTISNVKSGVEFELPSGAIDPPKLRGVDTKGETVNIQAELAGE